MELKGRYHHKCCFQWGGYLGSDPQCHLSVLASSVKPHRWWATKQLSWFTFPMWNEREGEIGH